MDCIFCKIVSGEIPSYKIYEDENVLAFLDIAGDVDGHTLVIPKNHCKNILDASAETLQNVILAVQKISNHYIDLGYDGVNVFCANNEEAQQSVFHLHFHIVPRKKSDNLDAFPHFHGAHQPPETRHKRLKMN